MQPNNYNAYTRHYFTEQVYAYRLLYIGPLLQKTLDRIDVSILRRGMERCSSVIGSCIHIKILFQQVVCNTMVTADKKSVLFCVIKKLIKIVGVILKIIVHSLLC